MSGPKHPKKLPFWVWVTPRGNSRVGTAEQDAVDRVSARNELKAGLPRDSKDTQLRQRFGEERAERRTTHKRKLAGDSKDTQLRQRFGEERAERWTTPDPKG